MSKPLSKRQFEQFSKLLLKQESCIRDILDAFSTLHHIVMQTTTKHYNKDIQGKLRDTQQKYVVEVYRKLQSFPLQHINEKLVQHPDYYHIQGAICVSMFYVMIAMDSKSLKDDKSLFKHLFECKDCCVLLCESALGTILELKQKNGIE
ncbi:hypothetical protein [Cellulophaga sp. BC115SP]|uniref:hypothetical protein n=1 Tax=Cellulophaga sp. BC115SP TaxID=2683263 RepID=UPI0014130EBC|nr:hypothetical protein [Cellulophaga sp. BC115SP]NBB27444.1 hypothetical protein [Cellulophaga sp. BC115SP]